MPRTRGGHKRRGAAKANQRVNNLQRAVNGQQLRVRPDPPTVTQIPWNQVVVTVQRGVDGFVYNEDVYAAFLAQCGFTDGVTLVFRFMEVRAWEINGKSLSLSVLDLIQNDGDYLAQMEDLPGRNHWACAGYRWPKAHSSRVFTVKSKTHVQGSPAICYVATAKGESSTFRIHVHLLWKYDVTSLPGQGPSRALHEHRSRLRTAQVCSMLNKLEVKEDSDNESAE